MPYADRPDGVYLDPSNGWTVIATNTGKFANKVRALAVCYSTVPVANALENPQPTSFQSGIGLFSGWSCQGSTIGIAIDGGAPLTAPYGSARADKASTCGAGITNTGFGLLINDNTLGAGTHSAQLFVNGSAQGSPTVFTVTVPGGQEFISGVSKQVAVPNFPGTGTTTTLKWDQARQNFAIITAGKSVNATSIKAGVLSALENPQPGSFQSGICLHYGWSCQGSTISIAIDGAAPLSVELARIGAQRDLDVAQALPRCQLRKRHDPNLLGAVHAAYSRIPGVAGHDPRETGPWNELHHLRKQRLACIHDASPRTTILGNYTNMSISDSNRHQTKSACKPRQYWLLGSPRLI